MRNGHDEDALQKGPGRIRSGQEGFVKLPAGRSDSGLRRLAFSLLVILVTGFILVRFDHAGRAGRATPVPAGDDERPLVYWVSTQVEAYGILKGLGVKGAEVVHFNRYFNLEEYFPEEQNRSRPFPVRPYDIRPDYEAGLGSGNWLFIANRTGLVRRVWNVLPPKVFRERFDLMREDYFFRVSDESLRGYLYDIPQEVTTLSALPPLQERVIVTVDAGFFLDLSEPEEVARVLRVRLPNIAVLILSKSLDEPDITLEARERLHRFLRGWYPG